MNIPLVDLKAQYLAIKPDIDQALAEVIATTSFIGGPVLRGFEEGFARACGLAHCVGVGNGTDAIYLALRALGVGPGDEVLVPANTFIATAEAVSLTGAKPVFVDVDARSYNMDPAQVLARLTPATRALLPVHLYGRPADMSALREIAGQRGLLMVEDAAQAHLASHGGLPVGAFSQAACFSFYPGKNLGAYGDGGAVVTNDEELALKIRMLANHGRITKYGHQREGVNSRLDTLQAAILGAKLPHLPAWTQKRREIADLYRRLLPQEGIILPDDQGDFIHVYHLFVIRCTKRDQLLQALKEAGVGAGVHYPEPLHLLEAYRHLGYRSGDFPVAEKLASEVLSLPMYPELSQEQVAYVADCVTRFVQRS